MIIIDREREETFYSSPSYEFNSTSTVLLQKYDLLHLFTSAMGLIVYLLFVCPVGWGCRIHWLHLCRGVRPGPNECPGYDTKQSDGEVSAVLELWGVRSTPSLPSLPGPLWPGVVAPDRALSMG